MATGRDTQLTKQIGEYLVAAELGRRGYVATTFTGNVPHFDILAADEGGRSLAIQVKAIRGNTWQFSNARQFVSIELEGKKQILGDKTSPPQPNLTHVFVALGEYGADRFFIFDWSDLQRIVVSKYAQYLRSKGGIRPQRYDSFHTAVSLDDLRDYEDNWELIEERFDLSA